MTTSHEGLVLSTFNGKPVRFAFYTPGEPGSAERAERLLVEASRGPAVVAAAAHEALPALRGE